MRPIRIWTIAAGFSLAFLALAPARAGDDDATAADMKRVERLSRQVKDLEVRQQDLLEEQIESYLIKTHAYEGAMADDALKGVTITAAFTGTSMSTVGLDPADVHAVAGHIDLIFAFEVADNTDLVLHFQANTGAPSRLPAQFPLVGGIGGGVGKTFSGESDGIGVDGNVGTTGAGRVLNVYEAFVRHDLKIMDRTVTIEAGAIDPRTRFHQVAFADDARTQFMNNLFADSSAVLWLTDATGRGVFGVHALISFGDNNQFTFNAGFFNTGGQTLSNGQGYFQVSWTGEVGGRTMNVHLFGFVDEFFLDPRNGDGSVGGGASWDWWVTDNIGVWLRFAANGDDVNPVELTVTGGVHLLGIFGRRPNDVIGVAVGAQQSNDNNVDPAIAGLPEDTEIVVEIYYTYMAEDGKLQISPHVQFISDPGGNGTGWLDDTLIIVGIRIHVPF